MTASWRDALIAFIKEQARPIEKYGHQPRLHALTQQIGQGMAYDDDVVFAAVYLHDLGVFTGHRPEDPAALARWDNTAYAIEQSAAILRSITFPESKIAQVLDCIRTHQPASDPQTLEATLLRDADIIEQLGAIAVLRTVCKIGRDTRFHTFSDATRSLRHALDTLPGLLRLPSSQGLALPRVSTLRLFLKSVEEEAEGNLH